MKMVKYEKISNNAHETFNKQKYTYQIVRFKM